MIVVKEVTNKTIWESFIAMHSPQSFFQSWNWGETVKKIQNSKFLPRRQAGKIQNLTTNDQQLTTNLWRVGFYENDRLVGIAQMELVDAKRGSFLHIRHGPILGKWDETLTQQVLGVLKTLGKRENACFLRISPLIEDNDHNRVLMKKLGCIPTQLHAMDGEYCWVLDITKSEEELLKGMRKTTRYLVRQAQKMGVVIKKTTSVDRLDSFFSLYEETAKRHGFVKHRGIREEFAQLTAHGEALLFEGWYEGTLFACAIILFYQHQAMYHHSASIQTKVPVNYLLQWEVIREAKRRGKTLYNLWGIAPEDKARHPWRGLTPFKKGFGGGEIRYLHAQDLPLSIKYCATFLIEWFRKISKGY